MTTRTQIYQLDSHAMHTLEWGEPGAPVCVLVHGFPDTAHTWRHLGPTMAAAGYHVVAPFTRGYAPSEVPADGVYSTLAQGHDLSALHEALGAGGDAVLVGHDWGATASYVALQTHPEYWRRAVTMSVPPLPLMASAFSHYAQQKMSWYMWFFQTPLAHLFVTPENLSVIDHLWRDWSPDCDGTEDIAHVKAALATTENLNAALGYYRAMFAPPSESPLYDAERLADATPRVPVRYLHGARDGCISAELIEQPERFLAPGSDFHLVAGAGHFLHLEQPDVIAALVTQFFN